MLPVANQFGGGIFVFHIMQFSPPSSHCYPLRSKFIFLAPCRSAPPVCLMWKTKFRTHTICRHSCDFVYFDMYMS